jgi:preprotein translocase subunit Sec61beta
MTTSAGVVRFWDSVRPQLLHLPFHLQFVMMFALIKWQTSQSRICI